MQISIPGYPLTPCFGAVYMFEYEGEDYFYGWSDSRQIIRIHRLPPLFELVPDNYILPDDLLNVAIVTIS